MLNKLKNVEHMDLESILREARRTDNDQADLNHVPAERSPQTHRRGTDATIQVVHAWLARLETRTGEDGRLICNAEQRGFLSRVVDRIVHEMQTGEMHSGSRHDEEDPMRWVLHGGPGTGKTHAVKLLRKELF